jgi:hypothetical protein
MVKKLQSPTPRLLLLLFLLLLLVLLLVLAVGIGAVGIGIGAVGYVSDSNTVILLWSMVVLIILFWGRAGCYYCTVDYSRQTTY